MSDPAEAAERAAAANAWVRGVVAGGPPPQTYSEHLEASRAEVTEAEIAHAAHLDPSNERGPEWERVAVELHERAEALAAYVKRVEADDPDKARGRGGINQGPQGSPPPVVKTGNEWMREGLAAAAGHKASRGYHPFG